jgi:probable rRNA maturation factor
MTVAAGTVLEIDVLIESGHWQGEPGAEATVRRALAEAGEALSTKGAELAILLTDDSAIRLLNRQWRGVDAPTNVLSFPATDVAAGIPRVLGDIVLAFETIAREAREEGKPFAHHLSHLAVHGFLHLLGYDHDRDADAEAMERLECRILAGLAIPDPYRDAAGG